MKNAKNTILFGLTAILLASCGGAGGGGKTVDTINIEIWEDQSNIKMLEPLAAQFEATYKKTYPNSPAIKITFTAQAEQSAVEKMVTVNPTGQGPDIAAVTHDTIITGATAGVIAPITFESDVRELMSQDAVNAVSTVASTGAKTVYGYPITAESQVVLYDTTKVTAAELASFEALKASGKKIAVKETNSDCSYYNFGFLNDAVLFGEDGTNKSLVTLQTSNAVSNLVSFYHDYPGCVVDLAPENTIADLASGAIVGFVTTPFMYSTIKDRLGDHLGVAKLPTINGQEQRPFSGYKSYVINSYSKYPSIANEVARFLTDVDAQWTRLDEACYYPALAESEFTEDIKETIASSDHALAFGASLNLSRRMPSIAEMANFWSSSQATFESFWTTGRGSLTEAAVKTGLAKIETAIKG